MTAGEIATVRAAELLRVTGLVQGVGFRPFVHRVATRYGLGGWVRNGAGEVSIAAEGTPEALEAFVGALEREAPPLTRIARIAREPCAPEGRTDFAILLSAVEPDGRLPVSPDVALCAACEHELIEPGDRRFRYPFITCTDCGPRFSVIEAMPYDRERTSMRAFAMCPECRREYETPGNRRHHSQTNSCPACGPRLWLEHADGRVLERHRARAIESAAAMLREGLIVAVRGLGGFHFAVDATDEAAVRRLRARKRRDAKPLAVMVGSLDEARAVAHVGAAEAEPLGSPERPIVVLRRRAEAPLAAAVAPGLDTVGLMLAYTPLHFLLLECARRPLVMTSGNLSDEPIATSNDEARRRLAGIADSFLLHDREIVARYDDSVVRVVTGAPVFLRRARGYAPLPLTLPVASPVPLVAVGPHLKNTLTLAHGATAYVSQHVGDLEDLETLEHFTAVYDTYRRLFRIEPEVAVRDLHPGYLSTRVAEELGLHRVLTVQHHHAHIAAVMGEHGLTDRVVGIAYDGTGLGDDGAVWGAEVLAADLGGYRRRAHLRYAPLPGGDLAARRPWRAALGFLSLAPQEAPAFARAFDGVDEAERAVAVRQIARRLNAPAASSMGRLFDAAAAVLGLRLVADYEGQAAMELEAMAGAHGAAPLPFPVEPDGEDGWLLDPVPLLAELGRRLARGVSAPTLAAAFHESVAAATAEVAQKVCEAEGLQTVVLGGGCFQNARLLASVRWRLEARGLAVYAPQRLSPNDGAISYGQAAIAAAILAGERAAAHAPDARLGRSVCA
ncbi:MAG: carbamoyltransferase HypF [Gemmatimonadales bacterium]|nr:carbamoyltransferase HypF [Gemmatimonadales bacterium]